MSETLKKIKEIINSTFDDIDLDAINDHEALIDQGLDSLIRTDLFITLGEEFGVDLIDVDENKLASLKDIEAYLASGNSEEGETPNSPEGALTKESLVEKLKELGVAAGDNLLVHSGLMKLGQLEYKSAQENLELIYQALREVLGKEGTLIVPAFYYEFGRWDKQFDLVKSGVSKELGAFSTYVLAQKESHRSAHPLTSLCAIGKNAEFITGGLNATSYGYGSAWDRLFELKGKMLFLGVDLSSMTFVHYIEHRAGVPHIYNKVHESNVVADGKELLKEVVSSVRYLDFDIVYNKYEYTKIFKEMNLLKETKIGNSSSYLVDMHKAFDFLIKKINECSHYLLKDKPCFRNGEIPLSGNAGEARE